MTQPIDLVLLGAGGRGADAYGPYALDHPGRARFVAVAEPDPDRREAFARAHGIPPERRFSTWEDLAARPQLAPGALVCTQDRMHLPSATAMLEAGYDVLVEKPLAPTLDGCLALVQTAERTGRQLQVCHVLRYTTFFRHLHDILESGQIGDLITVEQRENVAYWHMAHSFVRGHYRNAGLSSPMILAKCCHDLDILVWNLAEPVRRLSSTGSLMHYRPESVGPEIPARCTDGCPVERSCPHSAIGVYLEFRPFPEIAAERGTGPGNVAPERFPFRAVTRDPRYEARLHAIQTGPYGRCVYRCDNDVVDHQLVTMEMASGTSVVLAMHGHSFEEYRSMRYDGTRGTIRGRFGTPMSLQVHDHLTGRVTDVPIAQGAGGHGGGDYGLMDAFVGTLRGEHRPRTDAREALESHLLAFAAEEARLSRTVVDMDAFRARAHGIIEALHPAG